MILCQVSNKCALLTEAVMLFHCKGIAKERFILEPGGGTVNQNHFTHAYKWRRLLQILGLLIWQEVISFQL